VQIQQYSNITINYKYKRFADIRGITIESGLFFELCNFLTIAVMVICSTCIAIYNRGKNQLILRRLGVKEIHYWIGTFLLVVIPTEISAIVCGFVF
jgi:hypothetical protein